jgi:hypothetical protein
MHILARTAQQLRFRTDYEFQTDLDIRDKCLNVVVRACKRSGRLHDDLEHLAKFLWIHDLLHSGFRNYGDMKKSSGVYQKIDDGLKHDLQK